MNRVIAVVEGYTEQAFVRDVLAPWLGSHGVGFSARLVGKPGQKGGVGRYPRVQRDILALLKQRSIPFVTTMFDFYGMPNSWPGRKKAAKAPHARKASTVEKAVLDDISAIVGSRFDKRRFLPYIQMHEFEALLFSRPSVIADVVLDANIADDLQAIRDEFETPEEIDDSPETAPSKRIEKLTRVFHKPLHGLIAVRRIGIETIRRECPHFDEWLTALEKLGGTQ
jgi:uncharacterized protein DUF4276